MESRTSPHPPGGAAIELMDCAAVNPQANHAMGRLTMIGRGAALGLALGCLAVLLVAARLAPSPLGVATHTALGLQRCAFLERTGIPCPGCGMTTSFAWFVRGNLVASFYVQPMGAVLAALACFCVWGGLYVGVTGRPAYKLLQALTTPQWFIPLLGWALFAWAWKIFIHVHGVDGWR